MNAATRPRRAARPGTAASPSQAERAYTRIRDRIVSLDLAPGTPIEEESLMRELDLGRTPVREAIKRLALESLVEIYPRRGTFVSEVQITDLAAISEVRTMLEAHAASLAASRFAPTDEPTLTELLGRVEVSADADLDALMELDADVHRFIYATARNRYLRDTLDRYFNLALRIWHVARERLPDLATNVQQHRELLLAIRAGDRERAERVAANHVETFEREMRTVL